MLALAPDVTNRVYNDYGAVFQQEVEHPAYVATVGLSFKAGRFTLSPTIETYMMKEDIADPWFSPFRSDYEIRAELDLSHGMTFGAWHECIHTVESWLPPRSVAKYSGGETRIYLKISGVIGP